MKYRFLYFAFSFWFVGHTQQSLHVDDSNLSGFENGATNYPFSSIQQAIDVANSGDTIKVAQGNYSSISIIEKKLHLIGGFTGNTEQNYDLNSEGDFLEQDLNFNFSIINGDLSQACVYISIEQQEIAGNASINGFTIQNGQRGVSLFGEYSGFLSNITIENNKFLNNGTEDLGQYGGAIGFEGKNITIQNNLFDGNKAGRGAAISRTAGNPENFNISYNIIRFNQGFDDHAGAVFLNGDGVFSNNLVHDNSAANAFTYGWGGGIMVFNYDTTKLITLSHNIYYNNHAPSKGGAIFIDEAAKVLLDHELIYNNTSDEGGSAIYVDADFDNNPSVVKMQNCTVTSNVSSQDLGGGIYVQASICKIENCIFWENGSSDFELSPDGQAASSLEVNYTLSQESFPGTSNMSSDPLFVEPINNDFHVKSSAGHFDIATGNFILDSQTSPAIDAGNPLSNYSLEPNPNGNRVNLGCYGNTNEASKSNLNTLADFLIDEIKIYPNPSHGIFEIKNLVSDSQINIYNQSFLLIDSMKTKSEIIDLTRYNKGVYFLEINNQIQKIIIQ